MADLKEKLEDSLKEVKVLDDVISFIDLLIKLKEFQESEDSFLSKSFSWEITDSRILLKYMQTLFELDLSKGLVGKGNENKSHSTEDLSVYVKQQTTRRSFSVSFAEVPNVLNNSKTRSLCTEDFNLESISESAMTNLKQKKNFFGYETPTAIGKKFLELFSPGEDSLPFIQALSDLINQLHYLDNWDPQPLIKIIRDCEKLISESHRYHNYSSWTHFLNTDFTMVLKIGLCIANGSSDSKVAEILSFILRIGHDHNKFTVRDKKVIGGLIISAIHRIDVYIQNLYSSYRYISYASILRSKRALQTLFNEYAYYMPVIHMISVYQMIKENIEVLDKINKDWCEESDDSDY